MTRVTRGFVLAGGRSSRMGTDKALLELDGRTLLERAAAIVQDAAGSATVVGRRALYGAFGYPVIEDRYTDCGPLGGIHAALAWSDAEWNLIVACDMPGLQAAPLRELLQRAVATPDADIVLAEPLCAVYRLRALPVIENALTNGCLKIRRAISPLRVVHHELCDPDLFRNVNTPQDWQSVPAHLTTTSAHPTKT